MRKAKLTILEIGIGDYAMQDDRCQDPSPLATQ